MPTAFDSPIDVPCEGEGTSIARMQLLPPVRAIAGSSIR